MKQTLRVVLGAALLATACRRPAPETEPQEWEMNPGLDPHPTGRTLDGAAGPALPRTSFRLDSQRILAAATEERPVGPEEALYLRAARSGLAWAQTKLGTKYVMDGADLARMGEGLHWLNAAADQNDTEALRVLSALALEGRGVDQSDKEAYKYMRRAAELGSPEAQFELANMLSSGRGMSRDMEAAILWGRKAAEQGYAPAQFAVGRVLLASVEQERKNEAVDFLQRAVENGLADAALFLSTAFARGEFGLEKDEARAEALLKPCAEKGNAECQFALASLYRNGETFAEKREEALEWLRRAAEGGNRQAIEILRKGASP